MSARFERLLRLYNRLRRGPLTIEIATKWARSAGIEVSERQLYRDLNELQNLKIAEGENVVELVDEKNHKTWKLEYGNNSEKLTLYDINSFFLFKNFVPYTIYEHRKDSLAKFDKIIYREFSNNHFQKYIQTSELYLRRTNFNENMYGEIEHKKIEDLLWALQNKRAIIIEKEILNTANIHLAPDPFPLIMFPMELVFHRGRVHVAGCGGKDDKYLIFAIDKGFSFRLTNQTFDRKKKWPGYKKATEHVFGISDAVNKRVYNIQIEFTELYGLSCMNFFWHPTQKWTKLRNGNYMLHMKCGVGRELIGFLAQGLDKMKVHQPEMLKNLIIKKYRDSINVYEKDLEINEEESNKDY